MYTPFANKGLIYKDTIHTFRINQHLYNKLSLSEYYSLWHTETLDHVRFARKEAWYCTRWIAKYTILYIYNKLKNVFSSATYSQSLLGPLLTYKFVVCKITIYVYYIKIPAIRVLRLQSMKTLTKQAQGSLNFIYFSMLIAQGKGKEIWSALFYRLFSSTSRVKYRSQVDMQSARNVAIYCYTGGGPFG